MSRFWFIDEQELFVFLCSYLEDTKGIDELDEETKKKIRRIVEDVSIVFNNEIEKEAKKILENAKIQSR